MNKIAYPFLPLILVAALIAVNFFLSTSLSASTEQNRPQSLGGPADSPDFFQDSAVSNPPKSISLPSRKTEILDFAIPTTGWNWGQIHYQNAVDIANSCGTQIYAASEGLVTEGAGFGWNDGYGNYLKIEHPNKTITLYAHLKSLAVPIGKYVLKGELIGYMGNTGNTDGPTGCHLHFEVRGAKNPLAK